MSFPKSNNPSSDLPRTGEELTNVLRIFAESEEFQGGLDRALVNEGDAPSELLVPRVLGDQIVRRAFRIGAELFGKNPTGRTDPGRGDAAADEESDLPATGVSSRVGEAVAEFVEWVYAGKAKPYTRFCVDHEGVEHAQRLSTYLTRELRKADGRVRDRGVARVTVTTADPENPNGKLKKSRVRQDKCAQAPEHLLETAGVADDELARSSLLIDLGTILANLIAAKLIVPRDEEYCRLRLEGWKLQDIARKYGVAKETVCRRMSKLRRLVVKRLGLELPQRPRRGRPRRQKPPAGLPVQNPDERVPPDAGS
jgi:hypothetical protein